MWSNQKFYWLKGMIFTTVLFIFVTLAFFSSPDLDGNLLDWLFIISLFPFAFSGLFVGGTTNILVGFTLQYAIYLLVGAVIGWLYGKIKNRNLIHNS